MDRLLDFLAGPKEMETEDGETLRLLTAMEVLQARREAEELAQEDRERALCANACLLARALERGGFRSAAMEAVIAAYEKTLALKS